MSTGNGRPKKACGTCSGQKIRCTGERPTCTRCLRLKHICIYSTVSAPQRSKSQRFSDAVSNGRRPSLSFPTTHSVKAIPNKALATAFSADSLSAILLQQPAFEGYDLGLPGSLVSALIQVYFDHVYNASLLLHKTSFLETLAAGTARPHVVLSVCALAANFYRDANGQRTLRDHGFMLEWAQRAGRLVFSDVESFHEDNFVTFVNMSLFWHSQGSWRIFYLHKGNALNLLVILGLGSRSRPIEDSWKTELRRRRFWACYLMHAQNSESLSRFPVAGMEDLTLPWPERDFAAKVSPGPGVTLNSRGSTGGIYSKIITAFTLWSSVVALIKTSDPDFSVQVPGIHALDGEISKWWHDMPEDVRLTPANIVTVPQDTLPNILLVNIVYHQSLCALHASLVPLFCWGEGNRRWPAARQVSAQVAYEHACTASELFNAMLSTYERVSAMPSFIAYAAYCGCAIQIPFMWSSNQAVRERAQTNVRTNMRLMQIMAGYWKFASLLKVYVRCLYDGHKKNPTILENEPRYIDVGKLTRLKLKVPYAQASILESLGILHSKEDGYPAPGDEIALEIERNGTETELPSRSSIPTDLGDSAQPQTRCHQLTENDWAQIDIAASLSHSVEIQYQQQRHQTDSDPTQVGSLEAGFLLGEDQTLDIFHPLLDPQMLGHFSDGTLHGLSNFDTSLFNLDYFDLDTWNAAGQVAKETGNAPNLASTSEAGSVPITAWD